jgi:hypothetical protein
MKINLGRHVHIRFRFGGGVTESFSSFAGRIHRRLIMDISRPRRLDITHVDRNLEFWEGLKRVVDDVIWDYGP